MAGKKARQNAFLRLMSASGADTRSEQNYSLLTTREMVIGRDPSCQIALDPLKYRMISRRHAVIRPLSVSPDGGYRWHICDFNSANGTYLNGKLLQGCQELQAGDRITLGNSGPELFFGYEFNSLEATVLTPAKTKPRTANRTSSSEPDDVSLSQLLPIFSTGKDLTRKAYLVPGIITVICVIFLFLASGLAYQTILGSYLAGAAFYFVYQLCGKPKSWFALIAAGIATAIISLLSLGFGLFSIFDGILPGSLSAGLLEELVKVLPVVGAYLIGKVLASPKRERVGVWEPLDGILLGAASSVGFTILETFGLYVSGTNSLCRAAVGKYRSWFIGGFAIVNSASFRRSSWTYGLQWLFWIFYWFERTQAASCLANSDNRLFNCSRTSYFVGCSSKY